MGEQDNPYMNYLGKTLFLLPSMGPTLPCNDALIVLLGSH